jgi:hypothetical protein
MAGTGPAPPDPNGLQAALQRSSDAFGNVQLSPDQISGLQTDLGSSQDAEAAIDNAQIRTDSTPFQGQPPQQDPHLLGGLFPLLAIAAFGGKATKLDASAMLGASTGMVSGYLNGKQEVYEESKAKFDAAYQQFKDRMAQQDKVYQEMREAYKGRIDADIKALEFARQVTQDQATNQQNLLRDQETTQHYADQLHQHVDDMNEKKVHDWAMEGFEQQKLNLAKQAAAAGSAPASQGAVGMVLSGAPLNQVAPGYSKSASSQRAQLRDAAIAKIKADNPNMTDIQAGEELARRQVEYSAGKASTTQLTKMLGASRQASAQLDYNIGQVDKEMAKLGSSDISPVVNAIARGEEKWSGDPAYSGLFYSLTASATESARLLSGGQASAAQLHQGAADEAKQWANIDMTPASWKEVATQMRGEGQNKIKTYEDAIAAGQQTPESAPPPKVLRFDAQGEPVSD